MPTFFARRYMRPPQAVSGTEKTVGIVILVLVAAIVVAFPYHVATDRNYLFDVSEQVYAGAPIAEVTPRHEARPAPPDEVPNPFPDVGSDGWHAPQQVERFSADKLYVMIDGRAEAYLKFSVVGLTFGRYYMRMTPSARSTSTGTTWARRPTHLACTDRSSHRTQHPSRSGRPRTRSAAPSSSARTPATYR